MVRTIRWSVAVALVASAGMAGAQQVTAPTPPRTDLNPRLAVAAGGATTRDRNAAPIAPHAESRMVVEQPVGVRRIETAPDKSAPVPKPAQTKRNEAMMIVGGAALIVGAIIGDTPGQIIMIGGAGIGLYGLYQYLQ